MSKHSRRSGPLLAASANTAAACAAVKCERKKKMTGRRITFLGYGGCALAGSLWGTGFYFGRLALNEMSVEHMVLYRFLFASLGVMPVVFANLGRFRLTGGEVRLLLIAACFGIPVQFL